MTVEQGMMRPMSVRRMNTSPIHRDSIRRLHRIISARCCLSLAAVALFATTTSTSARAAWFDDATATLLGDTGNWSNKVELADINGDGRVDILIANGGNYDSAGEPEMSGALVQKADGSFEDKGATIFSEPGYTRSIKAHDVNGDGNLDLVMAATFQTVPRVLFGDGTGGFDESDKVPDAPISAGDVELGDCDMDGDLDALFADWGENNPFFDKGRPRVWINDGSGGFTDETDARMPTAKTGFSWDIEWIDADDDNDLDALISCKVCSDGGLYLENQGDCTFLDRSGLLPGDGNNYDFEAMDLDADGDLDLVTVNDGPNLSERLLINELNGVDKAFVDVTEEKWPSGFASNDDDNVALFLDVDSDGDSDVLIGSLSGDDRLYINELTADAAQLSLGGKLSDVDTTPGTLGLAAADFNGDGKPDLAMSQGEVDVPEKIYLGVDTAVDVTPPSIGALRIVTDVNGADGARRVLVRVHDFKTPVAEHDFTSLDLFVDGAAIPLTYSGEMQWTATLPETANVLSICALDRAGNGTCSDELALLPKVPDVDVYDSGCTSSATTSSPSSAAAGLALIAIMIGLGSARSRSSRRIK